MIGHVQCFEMQGESMRQERRERLVNSKGRGSFGMGRDD